MTGQDAGPQDVTKGQEIAAWIFTELEEARSLNEAEIATRVDAAVAEARAEAVKPYPVAEGDYALMRERMRRAEESLKERDAEIERLMIIIDGLREGEHEARREERERGNRPKCLYCTFGEDADFTIDDLKQHIERECDFHPLKRMRAALKQIRGLLVVKPHRFATQTEAIHAILDDALSGPPASAPEGEK